MSRLNTIIPLVLVTGIGVFNGMYAFEPAFREQQEQRDKTFEKQHGKTESSAAQDSATQESTAKSVILDKPESITPAVAKQGENSKNASGSSSWFKSWGLAWPGSKASNQAMQSNTDTPNPLEQPASTAKSQEKSD